MNLCPDITANSDKHIYQGEYDLQPFNQQKLGVSQIAEGIGRVYEKAWGKKWSGGTRSINLEDYRLVDRDKFYKGSTRESWKYEYLDNMEQLGLDLRIPMNILDNLVVREDYKWTLKFLISQVSQKAEEDSFPRFVLMGQPGIGTTMFLVYLLLHRLERRLCTAIQFEKDKYILFDCDGEAKEVPKGSRKLPRGCWALTDCSDLVEAPCHDFLTSPAVIIQGTSDEPRKWKSWVKRLNARIFVMDLPTPEEIAAIANEDGLDPVKAISLMHKWGPDTRTITQILRNDWYEAQHRTWVKHAAFEFARDPARFPNVLSMNPDVSPLLFIRPDRSRDSSNVVRSPADAVVEIPTSTLLEIFEEVYFQMMTFDVTSLYSRSQE